MSKTLPPVEGRFQPGQSGNPGGQPKGFRKVSVAYRELLETKGATFHEAVARFKKARGRNLCMADHQAIEMLKASVQEDGRNQIAAVKEVTDRVEGSVSQQVSVESRSFVVEVPVKLESAAAWMERYAPRESSGEPVEVEALELPASLPQARAVADEAPPITYRPAPAGPYETLATTRRLPPTER